MTDKETLSDKIKIGYELDDAIETKDVRGFIQKIEKRINDEFVYGYVGDCKLCKKEETLVNSDSDCMLCKIKQIIKEEAGKELTNHSPQIAREQKALKHRPREAPAEMALSEDTQTLCECGHKRTSHAGNKYECYCKIRGCFCKKFKPKKKGCGKVYLQVGKKKYVCGVDGLCIACSAGCKMRPWKDGEFDGWVKEKFKKGDEK